MADAPARRFVTTFEDSRRWRNIIRRPGDIVISTPPKSGTTWMQGIVRSLLWPSGDAPATRGELSPWVDTRTTPIGQLIERLERQEHRRFLKTHSPGDCIPFDAHCSYIVVYRHGLDALVSWGNHRATMRPEIVAVMNELAAAEGVAPVAERWDGSYDTLFDEWTELGSPVRHLASWWPRRHDPNVLFVHYADLSEDLDGEMRRIAAFLGLEPTPERWPEVIDRCRLDAMRAEADASGALDAVFEGGASAFFHRGLTGRWRHELDESVVSRYEDALAGLPVEAASWLEHGGRALGVRPELTGDADRRMLDTGRWHPIHSRLARRPTSSLDAIAERKVAEARAAGLFDDLPLHGKPIPDLDRRRQPGWWADRFVAEERNKVEALELETELGAAMPGLWRLESADDVRTAVAAMNAKIDRFNRRTTPESIDRLDIDETLETWRRLQRGRRDRS